MLMTGEHSDISFGKTAFNNNRNGSRKAAVSSTDIKKGSSTGFFRLYCCCVFI